MFRDGKEFMTDMWLIGAGPMSVEYSKVLDSLDIDYEVIGRGTESASAFKNATGKHVFIGGLKSFINKQTYVPNNVVVSVGVEVLAETAISLIMFGVKNILIEKPGALTLGRLKEINAQAVRANASVFIAYNRRFYDSVILAKKMIKEDGGLMSFTFDFTEWSHIIKDLEKAPGVKENWLIGNSSHVIDLAFFLGGKPLEMVSHSAGQLSWHPKGAVFVGTGISERGSLFSYHANWGAPGRWGIELLTKRHKLILQPLEALQSVGIGKIASEFEYTPPKDEQLKPGLKNMIKTWLSEDHSDLCSLPEQIDSWMLMKKITSSK